ncbi:DUF4234 domain-containing protein [Thalassotalea sp. PLHSN55]|uniref:DUF4234 domain-containing protein n=1 Tax=Thalassotalea sp. PLHSN55 TaxID=3435888 RepID=UPI003F87C019
MSDNQATPEISEAFAAPEADLANVKEDKPILKFERFSAWWVFLLSFITMGIYPVYWLYTRISKANELAVEDKVPTFRLNAFIVLVIAYWVLSFAVGFTADETGGVLAMINGVVSIAYFVLYLLVVFGARRAIREIINAGTDEYVPVKGILSGLGTFFGGGIYLQYKINQAIDNQS